MMNAKCKIREFLLSRDMRAIVAVLMVEFSIYLVADAKGYGKSFLPFTLLLCGLTVISMFVVQKFYADRYLLVLVLILIDLGFLVQQVELGSLFYTKTSFRKLFFTILITLCLSVFYKFIMPKLSNLNVIYGMMILQFLISISMIIFGKTVGDINAQGANISLFGITPFEIVKVLQIFVCAGLFQEYLESKITSLKIEINPEVLLIMHTLILVGCLVLASELGSLMVILAITAVGFLVYGRKRKLIRTLFVVICIFILVAFLVLTQVIYPKLVNGEILNLPGVLSKLVRVCTSLHPEYMASSDGGQGTLGLEALVMGGKFGIDIERRRVPIPQAESDFIFDDLVQSCGLIIGIFVIMALFALMVRGIHIAKRCKDKYLASCALLTTMLFTFEAVYHIGYNLTLLPISGIPLYFLSKSFLAIMTGMNLIAILLVISTGRVGNPTGKRLFFKVQNNETEDVIIKRIHNVYLCFGIVFIFELGALFYNSGVVPGTYQRADNLKVYATAVMDEKTILPGDVYDTNGNILVQSDSLKYLVEDEHGSSVTTERTTVYIDAPLYCQVIGYTGGNAYNILAPSADKVILGRNDYRLLSLLASKQYKEYGLYTTASKEGTKGCDTYLTIDSNLQQVVFDALAKTMDCKNAKGSAVVLDVKTGRILAMVSFPTYDTNDKSQMMEEMKIAEENGLEPQYPVSHKNAKTPGSIFKVFVAVALIDHGMEDFTVKNDSYTLDGWTCHASGYWSPTKQVAISDEIDLETALNISSNVYFSQAALALGKDRLLETAEKFMLYQDSFVDENQDGMDDGNDTYLELDFGNIEYNWDLNVSDGVLAQTGFGQGRTELSAIYAAMMMQGIANNGVMLKPYMIQSIVDEEGTVRHIGLPEALSQVTSEETSKTVISMMRSTAIECCNEHGLYDVKEIFDKYEVAGKTGTAENGDANLTNNAWYMSVAPARDPQYVVVVNQCETDKGGYRMMDVVADIYTYLFEEYN